MDDVTFPQQHAVTRRFTLGVPRNFSVVSNGATVVFLRSRAGDDATLCLWLLDVTSGTERILADPREFATEDSDLPAAERARRERARESAGGIVSYSITADGSRACFAVAGVLYVCDIPEDGASPSEVRVIATADGVFDPRLDPSGHHIAYVSDGALRVVTIDGSDDRVVADEDDPLVTWGLADFVAAEEMGRSRGYWWSPGGDELIACRVAEHRVAQWWIADPANPDREPATVRYPAAGTANPEVQLVRVMLDGSQHPIDWSNGGEFAYLADVVWTAGHPPLVVRQKRSQRVVSIAEVVDDVLEERQQITDDTWVELIPGSPSWHPAGLLTVEDRADLDRRVLCVDGVPVAGRASSELHVKSIVGLRDGQVITTAWTEPHIVHVVAIDPTNGAIEQLSSGTGTHSAAVGGGQVVIVGTTPDDHRTEINVGAASINSLAAVPMLAAEVRFTQLGDRQLPTAILLPRDHDGITPLPVLLDPYGGPHAQRVVASHNAHLVSQWFADQGFAVIITDGAGTPGRGPAFEREVWGDLAEPVLADQIAALDAAAEQLPFLDLDRVGIRGWSFGGYLAALAVLRRPDRFHAAVAGAPVTTWRLYDTHYTERYLGHPDEHPDHYDRSDLLLEVEQADGRPERPLLIIHGLADDNVVAAHSLRLSSSLLAAGRAHSVLPLSGVTHMTPQHVVAENLLHLQRDFLHGSLVHPVRADAD